MPKIVIVCLVVYYTIGLIAARYFVTEKYLNNVLEASDEMDEISKDIIRGQGIKTWVTILQFLMFQFWPVMFAWHYIIRLEDYFKKKKK